MKVASIIFVLYVRQSRSLTFICFKKGESKEFKFKLDLSSPVSTGLKLLELNIIKIIQK